MYINVLKFHIWIPHEKIGDPYFFGWVFQKKRFGQVFQKNPSFRIAMSGQVGGGRAAGVGHLASSQVYLFVNLFFKVICYLYSSVNCFHIW